MVKSLVWSSVGIGLFLAGEVVLSYYFLLDSGGALCESLQDHSSTLIDVFWVFLVTVTYPLIYSTIIVVFYLHDTVIGMELTALAAACDAVCNILKITIAYPRPFWYREGVEGYSCSFSFGDPSGHALVASGVYSYLVWRTGLNSGHYAIVGLILALMGFERIYGGLHTYSQYFLGLAIGLYLSFVFKEYQQNIANAIKSLKKSVLTVPGIVFVLSTFAVALACLWFRDPWWESDWNGNVEDDCEDFDKGIAMQAQFLDCVFVLYVAGAVLGYHLVKSRGIQIKKCALWHKLCFVFAGISVYITSLIITSFSSGIFEVDVVVAVLTDFLSGFLCFGGICLPFGFLRKGYKESVERERLKEEFEESDKDQSDN